MIRVFVVLVVLAFSSGLLLQTNVGVPQWNANSLNYAPERLGQTYDGIVLSLNNNCFTHTKGVLKKLDIRAVQKVPLSYRSEAVDKGLETFVGSRSYHKDEYLKVWSNRMAFIDSFEDFVFDTTCDHSTWRFFFEDDIQLHPSVSSREAKQILARGLALAHKDGAVYLGICGPKCSDSQGLDKGVEARRCTGACAHAFGFQKWKMREFLSTMSGLSLLEPENPTFLAGIYLDRYLLAFGTQVHKIWVLGGNLKSPVGSVDDHFGMLYQDRATFHSEIKQ